MFRKTWKTIKILLIIIVILICLPHSLLPRRESGKQKHELKTQQKEHGSSPSKTSVSDTIPKNTLRENTGRKK